MRVHPRGIRRTTVLVVLLIGVCSSASAVEIAVLSTPKEEAPGSFVTHVFAVTHAGTEPETYLLSFEGPPDWDILGAPSTITVGPNAEETLFVTLTIPPAMAAGEYSVTLTVTAAGDPTDIATASAQVAVAPMRDVELVAPTGVTVALGGRVEYVFVLINRGNGQDSLSLAALSSKRLEATVSPATVDLAPQERAEVHVRLDVPVNVSPGRDVLTITATSTLYDGVETDAVVFTTVLPAGPAAVGRVLMEVLPGRVRLSLDKDVLDGGFSSRLTFSTSGQILGGFFSASASLSDPLGPDPVEIGSFSILYRRSPITYTIGNVSQRLTELVRLSCRGGSILVDEEFYDLAVIAGGSNDETRFAGRFTIGPDVVNLGISYLGIRDPAPTYRSIWSLAANAEPLEDWTIGLEGALGIDGSLTSRALYFTMGIDTAGLFFRGTAFSVGTNFPGSRADSAGIEVSHRLHLQAISLSVSLNHVWGNVIGDPSADTLIEDGLGFNLTTTPLEDGPTLNSTVQFAWDRYPDLGQKSEIDTLLSVSLTETAGVFPYAFSGKVTDQIDHVVDSHIRRSTFSEGAGLSVDSFYLFLQLMQEKQVDVVSDVVLASSSDVSVRFRPESSLHEASITFRNTVDEFDLSASLYVRFIEGLDIVFDGSVSWDRVDSDAISFGWGITLNADVGIPTPFFVTKGQVEGRAFIDRDGDGAYGVGDHPLGGIIVAAGSTEVSTDAEGTFRFAPFYPGAYTLTARGLPADAATDEPIEVSLAAGETLRVDVPLVPVVVVTGNLFDDANQNAVWDQDEGGVAQVRVLLTDSAGVATDTTTDAAGAFSFFDVRPGRYAIRFGVGTLPDRFEFTTPEEAGIDVTADAPAPIAFGGFVRPREVIITFQPPTADFSFSPDAPVAGEPVDFDGSLSFDFDGEITTYAWDFDADGATDATGDVAQHTFPEPGAYDVSLTVIDDSENSDTATLTIGVGGEAREATPPTGVSTFQPPIADFAFMPASPIAGEPVQFDGTDSTGFDGDIVSYSWDFDEDGSVDATGPIVTTTFPTAGTVSVSLTVTDDSGNQDSVTVSIVIADAADGRPAAAIQRSPVEPTAGEPVLFNGTSSLDPDGQIVGFAWDFDDDGEIDSTAPLAEHTFAEPASYTVTLTVTDDDGNQDTITAAIVIAPPKADAGGDPASFQPPVADFAYMPAAPSAGDPVLFNGTFSTDFDGEIASYAWDFDGDGTVDSTDAIAEHTFAAPGSYAVSLTVTDNGGNTDTITNPVDIE